MTQVHYWSNWLRLCVLPCHSCGLWVCTSCTSYTSRHTYMSIQAPVHTLLRSYNRLCLCGVFCPSVGLLLPSLYHDYPTFVIAIVIIVFIVHSFVFMTPVYELQHISHMPTPGHRFCIPWLWMVAPLRFLCTVSIHSVSLNAIEQRYKERERGAVFIF